MRATMRYMAAKGDSDQIRCWYIDSALCAGVLVHPTGIAVDFLGNLFVTDEYHGKIFRSVRPPPLCDQWQCCVATPATELLTDPLPTLCSLLGWINARERSLRCWEATSSPHRTVACVLSVNVAARIIFVRAFVSSSFYRCYGLNPPPRFYLRSSVRLRVTPSP